MKNNPTIPSREVLKQTLANSGHDFPLDELEAIYAEFARAFDEEAESHYRPGEVFARHPITGETAGETST
jgi:hypothetical protein